MKNFIFYFFIVLIYNIFISCNDNFSEDSSQNYNKRQINIDVLTERVDSDTPYPKTIVSLEDWNIIEYSNKGMKHEYVTIFHFINAKKRISMVVTGYKSTIFICEYNPFTDEKSDTVVIAAEKQGMVTLALCKMNWDNNSYTVLSETILENQSYFVSTMNSTNDEFDDIRALTVKTLDELSNKISQITFLPSKFSNVGVIATIWNKCAIPWAKYSLYEDYPEIQQQISEDYALGEFEKWFLSIIPQNKSNLYKKAKNVYNNSKKLFGNLNNNTEITDETIDNLSLGFSYIADESYNSQIEYGEELVKYKVSLRAYNIEETSAKIDASVTCMDGQPSYISKYGINVLGQDGKSFSNEYQNFDNSITITGLSPGNRYSVTAYIYSLGKIYESTIDFTTNFTFELHPKELIFEAIGGTKAVAIILPENGWKSWEIKSKPNWCKIEKSNTSFFIKVTESNIYRDGSIIVAVNLNDNSIIENSLKVIQNVNNWDGTKWSFSGNMNVNYYFNGEILTSQNYPLTFEMEIYNVETNKMKLVVNNQETVYDKIYIDKNNNLILEAVTTAEQYDFPIKIVFTRTDINTAYGTFDTKWKCNEILIEANGNFNGVLVDSNNSKHCCPEKVSQNSYY